MINNLPIIPETISLSELRYKTAQLKEKLEKRGEPVLLVNRTKKFGVILPISLYDQLTENTGSKLMVKKKLHLKNYPLGIKSSETRRKNIYKL